MTNFFTILIGLLFPLLPLALALIINGIEEEQIKNKNDYIRVTFQQFYDVYKATERSKWILEKKYILYAKHNKYGSYCGSEIIYFKTILDKIQYKIFKKITNWKERKDERRRKQSLLSTKTVEIMQMWSEDIESYKLESIKELQSMIDKNNKKVDEYKKRVEELKHETEKF